MDADIRAPRVFKRSIKAFWDLLATLTEGSVLSPRHLLDWMELYGIQLNRWEIDAVFVAYDEYLKASQAVKQQEVIIDD